VPAGRLWPDPDGDPQLAGTCTGAQCFKMWTKDSWHQDLERDKLEAWAEDRIASAEQALKDTKLKLKGLKRQARMALSMEDAQRLQQDIRKTEAEQRRQRSNRVLAAHDPKLPAGVDPGLERRPGILHQGDQLGLIAFRGHGLRERLPGAGQQEGNNQYEM
jgi:hypothetical protein